MDFFRPCRSTVPVLALAILLLAGVAGRAEDQAKPPATKPPEIQPKPAETPAKPAIPPKPTISAKKEGEGILGKPVYSADGADMGLVTNVLVDHTGNPIGAVIDFGGFLGVGTRKIAVDWRLMKFHPGDKEKPITLGLEKDQLKSAPTYNPDKPPRIVGAPSPTPPAKPAAAVPPGATAPAAQAPKPAPASPDKPASAAPPSTTPTPPAPAPAPKDNTGK